MIKLIILFLSINTSLASDFELISFSHKEAEYSKEEILSIAQMDEVSFMQTFGCANTAKNDLFTDYLVLEKAERRGLYLLNEKNEIFIYLEKNLTPLNNAKKDSFIKMTYQSLLALENYPSAKILLRQLERGPYPLYIKFGWPHAAPNTPFESNSYQINNSTFVVNASYLAPQVPKMIFNKIGAASTVFWNPSSKINLIESDNISRRAPRELILGHELYHAYDTLRGFIDRRMVFGEDYEQTEVTEYRAVRFENTLRDEMKLLKRKYYSNSKGSDMLDENGASIIMPTPCIAN